MDPALLALATTSANALITLMATDVWTKAKEGVVRLLTRSDDVDEASIAADLETSREELQAALGREDAQETREELQHAWRGKFRRLVIEHPELDSDLRDLARSLEDMTRSEGMPAGGSLTQHAVARDHGRVYQQGSGTQNNY
ncbi:hypothetical protein [Streptomyces sp. NPDC056056]|uniref:hypothetical protein n=1 Tax=Streptomyces sp. NPDC056056 TaxID=3345698 RepID=UPI0035DC48F8